MYTYISYSIYIYDISLPKQIIHLFTETIGRDWIAELQRIYIIYISRFYLLLSERIPTKPSHVHLHKHLLWEKAEPPKPLTQIQHPLPLRAGATRLQSHVQLGNQIWKNFHHLKNTRSPKKPRPHVDMLRKQNKSFAFFSCSFTWSFVGSQLTGPCYTFCRGMEDLFWGVSWVVSCWWSCTLFGCENIWSFLGG